jgi:nucleotide-binding universal stress UspA family protein
MARIVVGVDASAGALAALDWACEEAARRGATVQVVTAYAGCGESADQLTAMEPWAQAARHDAEETLDRALEARRAEVDGGVAIETTVVDGDAAHALLRLAEGADLLVVGSPGHGVFAGLLLGSVSHACVQHAPCPVVVVPAAPPGR